MTGRLGDLTAHAILVLAATVAVSIAVWVLTLKFWAGAVGGFWVFCLTAELCYRRRQRDLPLTKPSLRFAPGFSLDPSRLSLSQVCPWCRDHLFGAEELRECNGCRTVTHRDCLQEAGRCTTLGCAQAYQGFDRWIQGDRAR